MRYHTPFKGDFFVDNLLVRNHFIIVMIKWTGLAPWGLNSLFQVALHLPSRRDVPPTERRSIRHVRNTRSLRSKLHACVCVCIYIYIYTHTHTYIYTHIHIMFQKGCTSDGEVVHPTREEHALSPLETVFFFFFTLVTGPSRSLRLKLSDTRVYEPQIQGMYLRRRGDSCDT